MNYKKLSILASLAALGTPLIAAAQPIMGGVTLDTVIIRLLQLLNLLIPVLIALAVVGFFWGVAQFIFSGGDTAKRATGLNFMVWGVIALFVMVSVWGLVAMLQNTFQIGPGGPMIPQFGGMA